MSELDAFKAMEQELAIRFKQVDEIKSSHRYAYALDDQGRVSGLALNKCAAIAPDVIIDLVRSFPHLRSCVLSSTLIFDLSFLKELTNLQWLSLGINATSDHSFLKDLTNLQSLELWGDTNPDYSFLKNLTHLQYLTIRIRRINDVSFLKDLTNLQSLELWGDTISDVSFLSSLTNLQSLKLGSKKIHDVSFIEDLTNLHEFGLTDTQFSDVSFLRALPNLTSLDLGHNPIEDLSFFKDLTNLESLTLLNSQNSDLSILKGLTHLQSLFIWANWIKDVSFLRELSNLQTLLLWNNQVSDISFLEDLPHLQSLSLRSKQLSDFSPLAVLTHLQSLSLSENTIGNLSFLWDHPHLQSLVLSYNNIRDVSVLKNLMQLQSLNLSNNNIHDISPLKNLTHLQSLNVSNNQISDLSVLRDLTQLRSLKLEGNQIKTLPGFIMDFGLELIAEEFNWNDHTINLFGNPITSPPMEIIGRGNAAVRDYFRSFTEKQYTRFNEVKVLFVGEGLAGKTSLLKQIQGLAFDKDESQTHGINVVQVGSSGFQGFTDDASLRDVRLNCWDFGGQEVMHASHRFFMSKRSLYVLLLDSRTDAKKYHWLKHIEKYGGDSPVIVVMNKIDANPNYNIEQNKINEAFPHIQNRFCRVSCKNGQGIPEFMTCLARSIPETPLFGTPISQTWLDIKDRLVSETSENRHISRERFETICAGYDMDDSSRKTLLRFLHDLGIVLYFDNLDLSDIYVLDPHWVTIGVYKIINSSKITKGILDEKDLDFILNREHIKADEYDPAREKAITYSPQEQRYLLKIMMQFELCYEYDHGKGLYMIPDQLPKELSSEPELNGEDALSFVMQFDYLPSSLFSRLMIAFRHHIVRGCQWKYGMLLMDPLNACRAKVVSREEAKTITITVQGESLRKREYLSALRRAVHDIGREFENLVIDEFIPLPGYPDFLVGYRELMGYENAGKDDYFSGKLERTFSVSRMLDSVISKEQRTKEARMPDINVNIENKFENIGNPRVAVQQRAELTATQEQTVTQEVKTIQGLFKNLKEDLLDEIDIEIEDPKEKKRIQNELNKAESAFRELEQAAADGRKELDDSTKSRLGEFIDNLADENSRINKALKLISRGAEKAKNLGKTYNKFAPYFGLPNVPPILLGD